MHIFVSASYSSKVNYDTGEVFAVYKQWLESVLQLLESLGHEVFCALRADQYKINGDDPAQAFSLDMDHITASDVVLALVTDRVSAGVQTEIGVGVALGKQVIVAHEPQDALAYFNAAMAAAGAVHELLLPLDGPKLEQLLQKEGEQ